ncbi:hypothetical protein AK972_1056 [Pseudomonas yamanorum]|nr:hypothetical protein AK972_1056 [Pseudomonas yamanorum]
MAANGRRGPAVETRRHRERSGRYESYSCDTESNRNQLHWL